MADRTSIVACATISIGCSRLCGWLARSAFSRRSTFSTPTTASSTSPPMAMARPPSVIVLIDRPKYLKTSAVMKIDTGMAVSAMMVGRNVPRKKNRITATKIEAPISLPCSVVIEASMKLAWRKVTRGASMPAGRDAFSPTRASSMDLRERDGVGGRLLLDAQDHGRLAFVAGVAALECRGEGHLGDLAHQDRLAVLGGERQVLQVIEA